MAPPCAGAGRAAAAREDVAELTAADLELLGRICDELRGEDGDDVDMDGAEKRTPNMTADEMRREKNRLKVRRHYHRRLRLMSDLRRQVALLETQLRHLQLSAAQCQQQQQEQRQGRHRSEPAAASHRPLLLGSGGSAPTDSRALGWQAKLALLAELERVRGQLERENRALRHCVAFQHACEAPRASRPQRDDRRNVLRPPPSFLVVRPLAAREVQSLRAQLRAQVAAFSLDRERRVFSRLGSVRGWDAERGVNAGLFKFLLRRRSIREARPEALLRATWALLTDDRRFRALFSPRLGVACNVVQPIDGDNALALLQYNNRAVSARGEEQEDQEQQRGDGPRTVKTLYVVAKFSEPQDAHTIVLRGVERRPLVIKNLSTAASGRDERSSGRVGDDPGAADAPEEEWTCLFTWLRFERTEDGTSLTFGGAVPTLDARSPFWLVELFLIALRWEQAVLT